MKKSRRENGSPTHQLNASQPTDTPNELTANPSWQAKWDDYWFTPQSAAGLMQVQRIVCIVAAMWFISLLNANDFWWGPFGLNAADFSGRLEGFTEGEALARFRWTPLWITNSFTIVALWCILGVCLSILSFINFGGRVVRGLLAVWILLLSQRLAWGNGLLEPYLMVLTGYLALARLSTSEDWSHQFALRLIQVHTWLLLCASLANQLAFSAWWQGEAVWWLTASGRSTLLSTSWFEDRLMLVNLLTHGITLCTAVAIGCLWPLATRSSRLRTRCGIVAGMVVALAYALVADQILFGCLLAASALAWREK